MRVIHAEDAPSPAGHYAQGVEHNGFVFVSGQLSIDPATGRPVGGTPEGQTERALRNVRAVLVAAGSDLSLVVKTTVYVSDIELWPRVNAAYARFFGDHRPARAVVPTRELHHGCLVEVEAVAALPEPSEEADA